MSCLLVDHLYKRYGDIHAVRGVSFEVSKGICFGLLGPNGAGKSTTIEILEDVKKPTSGRIFFNGQLRDQHYKEQIGIQFQSTALQDYMTVREALEVFSSFYKKSCSLDFIIKLCKLEEIINRDHRHLSGGQKKRLLLGLSLINNPDLIFLDEPTTGLDPASRMDFWKLIELIKKQGRTIILTTHYMDEAYFLCDEILMIDKGKVLDHGSPKSLIQKYFTGSRVMVSSIYKNQLQSFLPKGMDKGVFIEWETNSPKQLIDQLVSFHIQLEEIQMVPYNLDDLFIHLTGRALEDENKSN